MSPRGHRVGVVLPADNCVPHPQVRMRGFLIRIFRVYCSSLPFRCQHDRTRTDLAWGQGACQPRPSDTVHGYAEEAVRAAFRGPNRQAPRPVPPQPVICAPLHVCRQLLRIPVHPTPVSCPYGVRHPRRRCARPGSSEKLMSSSAQPVPVLLAAQVGFVAAWAATSRTARVISASG